MVNKRIFKSHKTLRCSGNGPRQERQAWKREQGLHHDSNAGRAFSCTPSAKGKGPELRRQVCAAASKTGETMGLACAYQDERQQGGAREGPLLGDSERNRVRNKVGVGIKN